MQHVFEGVDRDEGLLRKLEAIMSRSGDFGWHFTNFYEACVKEGITGEDICQLPARKRASYLNFYRAGQHYHSRETSSK